ncbi:hypothetical protein FA13DRAFT_1740963 [Coprinellus micaceus]|uniref:Uncharacterized protein n=1 Tax=Coprinellus micaceus TaxID=71717 RepID=A0A4Y7SL34_COPMI|nr:hypothetical protein FA13DRAFT_1740963 [Coprinellus micaceus]
MTRIGNEASKAVRAKSAVCKIRIGSTSMRGNRNNSRELCCAEADKTYVHRCKSSYLKLLEDAQARHTQVVVLRCRGSLGALGLRSLLLEVRRPR